MLSRVDGALSTGYACAVSSRVRACSIAATLPSVPTLTESTARVSSRATGTFAAGEVIPVAPMLPARPLALNPPAGYAAVVAPAGQRPRAGTVASCAHETTLAGTWWNLPFPSSPMLSNLPGMVSPGSMRITTTPWMPGIARSRAASGAAGAAGPAPVKTGLPGEETPSCSVSMLSSATVPNRLGSLAFCVVMATTATVVTNRARTRPLTARKAALGSLAMRRAAISVPGRLVHRAMALAAAMVSHGPAMNRPRRMSAKLDTNAWT